VNPALSRFVSTIDSLAPADWTKPQYILDAIERRGSAIRNCGTGAGGFQPGNSCGGGGNGLSGLILAPSDAEGEAMTRLEGVIDPKDPLAATMLRAIARDIPSEHYKGLATVSSGMQGVDITTRVKVSDGTDVVRVLGYYSPSTAEIVLSGGDNVATVGGGTLQHEIGHHVHERRLTPEADREWRGISDNGRNAAVSAYARTSRGEHFAEAYRCYARGERDRRRLRNAEPRAYAFMAKVFKKGSKMLYPDGRLGDLDKTRWGD